MQYFSIKHIIRNLWKHKSFTFINVLGLSLGIASVVMLFLIANYENSFDRLHSQNENIYRVVSKTKGANSTEYSATVPYPTGGYLQGKIPGVTATQVSYADDLQVQVEKKEPFILKNVVFADALFFDVFDFSKIDNFWISGSQESALNNPNTAILTESHAIKIFGNKNPLGETLRLDNKLTVEVVGIIKDIPTTTHLPIAMLVSYSSLTNDFLGGLDLESWTFSGSGYSYLKFSGQKDLSVMQPALQSIVQLRNSSGRMEMFLQPLSEIHFDPTFEGENPSYTVSDKYLTMLLLLGGFILLIACVNYVNLSTSFAFTKSKEVGVRKTIGASKRQLFIHYMMETFVITIIAALIGILLVIVFLPMVNGILDKSISVTTLMDPLFLVGALGIILFISFLSGTYPALMLSGFNPVYSLKNQLAMPGKSSVILRKGLVIFQFTTSIALIICTLVFSRQMQFFQDKELGFNKEAVVEVKIPNNESTKREAFRSLLLNETSIEEISFAMGAPISSDGISVGLLAPQLPNNVEYIAKIIPSDKNYKDTYQMKLLAGRWFLSSEEKNIGTAVVINRTMAELLGYYEPVEALGSTIELGLNEMRPTIVGVTEDFHTASLHEDIPSVALLPFPYFYYAAGIKINRGDMVNSLATIEKAWKKIYPESVYEVTFIDEALAASYKQETQNYQIFKAFSFISIFICCIGLWGLISFVVVRKTKEIGIRKVLGASVRGIVLLLSKDFLLLITIALIIASPLAWYFMDEWLKDFAYRIDIGWLVFAIAGLLAIVIAFITISFQTFKAGMANPVKNLRTE